MDETHMKTRLPTDAGRRPVFVATLIAACLIAGNALAQEDEITEFTGTASTTTAEFEVEAPWIIDWRAFSDFPQSMFLEISLLDATTGLHRGVVKETRAVGTGVKMFSDSGTYKLRIQSDLARWQVLIKELSEEEAARYTPQQKEGVLGDKWFRNKGD
jgi:hypothetical protein